MKLGLDIRGKMILILVVTGALSAAVISWLGFESGKENLTQRITSELSVRRDLTAGSIERYFKQTRNEVAAIADMPLIRKNLPMMNSAFRQIQQPSAAQEAKLKRFYETDFSPSLPGATSETQLADSFLPSLPAAKTLQSVYITKTSNPAINDAALARFSTYHNVIHSNMSVLSNAIEYRDIMLVSPDGNVVYTRDKEVDFAANLLNGPFDTSGMARAFKAALDHRGTRNVHIEDYSFYRPSAGAAAIFMSTPIYNEGDFLGVLIVQLSADYIQFLVNEAGSFGESGEVYLVGADGLLRSDLRSYQSNPEAFFERAKLSGIDPKTLNDIQRLQSGIGALDVRNDAVFAAMQGNTVTMVSNPVLGEEKLLASVKPLNIEGLSWAIAAEMPLSEAYAPIYDFKRDIVIAVTLLTIAMTVFASIVSGLLTRPIKTLSKRSLAVSEGKMDIDMRLDRHDEFGELSNHLQTLTDHLRYETQQAEQARSRIEGLLAKFMPQRIVKLLTVSGAKDIMTSDHAEEISILIANITNYDTLVNNMSIEDGAETLNNLICDIDAAVAAAGIEKVRTAGPIYVAAAGLSTPQIDHSQRLVNFAFSLVGIFERFKVKTGHDLHVKVGIASGPVIITIVGDKMYAFELFGKSKEEARNLADVAAENTIAVTKAVADKLTDDITIIAQDDYYIVSTAKHRNQIKAA